MRYFYKYTCLRDVLFKDLMLRATPFKYLNDPFEGIFNEKQFRDANNKLDAYYTKQGHVVEKLDEYMLDGVMDSIQDDFNNVGVLSFTEDYTNPLMWAHYADEHRGIVLEFDSEKPLFQDSIKTLGERKSRFGKDYLGNIYEFPEKVMYRREMPCFERGENINPKSDKDYHWIKFFYSLFYTKANDWIYEKELRSIVQLSDADRIICEKDDHVSEILRTHPEIEEINIEDKGKIQITYPNEYEMHEDMGDESIRNEIFLHTSVYSTTNMHFFRINPDAISRIYCGCKCDHEYVQKLIEENEKLKHLKNSLYKMEIDQFQYQLKERRI